MALEAQVLVSENRKHSLWYSLYCVYIEDTIKLLITTLMLEALFVLASEMSLQQNQKNF